MEFAIRLKEMKDFILKHQRKASNVECGMPLDPITTTALIVSINL